MGDDWDPFAIEEPTASGGAVAPTEPASSDALEVPPITQQWYGRYYNDGPKDVQPSKIIQILAEEPPRPQTVRMGLINGPSVSDPGAMISVADVPWPDMDDKDPIPRARVGVAFCMFAPGDVNNAQGNYYFGKAEAYPTPFGGSGSGIVMEINESARRLTTIREGDTVTSIAPCAVVDEQLYAPGWATQEMVCDARILICIPKSVSLEDANFVCGANEATAYQLVTCYCGELQPGDWIVHNLANSRVGRNVTRIAAKLGFKTVSIVRSEQAAAQCRAVGTNVVVIFDEGERGAVRRVGAEIAAATNNAPVHLAFNGVGGKSAQLLFQILAPWGKVVTYGGMGQDTMIEMSTRQVLFEHKLSEGYMMWDCWIPGCPSKYYSEEKKKEMIRFLIDLFLELGPIEECDVYNILPLTEVADAFRQGAASLNEKKSFPRILIKCCDEIFPGWGSA